MKYESKFKITDQVIYIGAPLRPMTIRFVCFGSHPQPTYRCMYSSPDVLMESYFDESELMPYTGGIK